VVVSFPLTTICQHQAIFNIHGMKLMVS